VFYEDNQEIDSNLRAARAMTILAPLIGLTALGLLWYAEKHEESPHLNTRLALSTLLFFMAAIAQLFTMLVLDSSLCTSNNVLGGDGTCSRLYSANGSIAATSLFGISGLLSMCTMARQPGDDNESMVGGDTLEAFDDDVAKDAEPRYVGGQENMDDENDDGDNDDDDDGAEDYDDELTEKQTSQIPQGEPPRPPKKGWFGGGRRKKSKQDDSPPEQEYLPPPGSTDGQEYNFAANNP